MLTKPGVVLKEDERLILKTRATEYWDLMVKVNPKNVEQLYRYQAPSFREKVPIAEYVQRFKLLRYMSAEITDKIEIENNNGKVKVVSNYQYVYRLRLISRL